MSTGESKIDYRKSGVDQERGDALVEWLKSSGPKTFPHQKQIVSGIGGFAALFRAPFQGMKSPCIVSSTDGVGTKVKLATHFQKFDTVGQDLVGMCVTDLICCGATPLFFLDYYATGKLNLPEAKSFLGGLRDACHISGCALIGGETAEMPGVYQNGDFDCAGFAIGVVDEPEALGPHLVQEGDCVIGVSSSGFHSNGYSLLRRIFADDMDKWRDLLLTPTALYAPLMKALLEDPSVKPNVRAAAHITGGGIENVPRILPENTAWKMKLWKLPDPFVEAQKRAGLTEDSLYETFNCG
ncbi:MAG: phosphoribosylformylglycinamidine cyclo-ligase, partial [Pseudobdellovibrionaceae bacterium]